jgi:hypothetical protein
VHGTGNAAELISDQINSEQREFVNGEVRFAKNMNTLRAILMETDKEVNLRPT